MQHMYAYRMYLLRRNFSALSFGSTRPALAVLFADYACTAPVELILLLPRRQAHVCAAC
jgi:hypothetical protein